MTKEKQSIAIIGSGVTGLSAAWLLHKKYDVTLYEKNDYLGGHTHTHEIEEKNKTLNIDSGFIVYNKKNYPNLVGLFNELDVKSQNTEMSFAFSLNRGALEYAGTGFFGMFAQRRNYLNIKHWKLLKEILRFNKIAHAELKGSQTLKDDNLNLGQFLSKHKLSTDLQQHYLLPMGAAIWSCPMEIMNEFPAYSFLKFFENHGLIDLKNRPQWQTVIGGSNQYVKKIMKQISPSIKVRIGANFITRDDNKICIDDDSDKKYFDNVIFACHADEALALLVEPTQEEKSVLACFRYEKNIAILHTDENVMPKRKAAWCSWNYQALTSDNKTHSDSNVTATYWMNKLQKFDAKKNYLVTLNPYSEIDNSKIIKKMSYQHPIFDQAAISAQSRLRSLQGANNSYFCGSYAGYGFHEDALASSVKVCELLGVDIPWK